MACIVLDHPLARVWLSTLRQATSDRAASRSTLSRLGSLLFAEACREKLRTEPIKVQTPLELTDGDTLVPPVLVAVLRAGLGLMHGAEDLLPEAAVGHVGVRRDPKSLEAFRYVESLPHVEGREVFVFDPMLATGHSAAAALEPVMRRKPAYVALLTAVAAPEGVAHIEATYPDVQVYTCALDRGLNEKGYILPGLGDAGDRLFGTV